MAQWKVSPTEGVTNHNNGKFTFIANAPHSEYTISYTDDAGCTTTYTYKLKTDCSSCECSVGSRYVKGNGTGAYKDFCPKDGFPAREKPYVIGYYTKNDCEELPTFTFERGTDGTVSVEQFLELWEAYDVETGFTTTEPQYDETGIYTDEHKLPKKTDFTPPITHYITASTIPPNPYGFMNIRFKPSCHKTHYFSFQEYGGGAPPPTNNCSADDFDCFLEKFSSVATITEEGTPRIYSLMKMLYLEAYEQFYNNSTLHDLDVGLTWIYKKENLPNIYDFYGTKENKLLAFNAMVGFLFAMLLSDLKPSARDEIYKIGYKMGDNNRDVSLYGYEFHSDPNVARLMASIIYAALREDIAVAIRDHRADIGGAELPKNLWYYYQPSDIYGKPIKDTRCKNCGYISRSKFTTCPNCGSNKVEEIDHYDEITVTCNGLNDFFPYAPGPYYPGLTPEPHGSQVFPHDEKQLDYNLKMDGSILAYIVGDTTSHPYILTDSVNSARTAQAVADKETCPNHFFGTSHTVTTSGLTFQIKPVFDHNIATDGKLGKVSEAAGWIASGGRWLTCRSAFRVRPGRNDYRYTYGNDVCDYNIENEDGCPLGNYVNGVWTPYTQAQIDEYCDKEHQSAIYSSGSFPSGHSSYAWMNTLILISMHPELTTELMKEGYSYTVNRTVTRWHWNSDIINGRIIGAMTYPLVRSSKDFDTIFREAQQDFQ